MAMSPQPATSAAINKNLVTTDKPGIKIRRILIVVNSIGKTPSILALDTQQILVSENGDIPNIVNRCHG
jgi:hypothetical protein